MVWTDSPSWITCWNAGNDYVRAMKDPDIEFMMAQHPGWRTTALLADLILPVNTSWKRRTSVPSTAAASSRYSFVSGSASNPWASR